ncbi:MAG TPA: hypothetical protein VKI41_03465 [Vicinamibacteria bacterium]|nr:hypothetical protein [Vicinamibacteria bacterium]
MTEHPGPGHPEVDFERTDVDATALLKFAFWLVVATVAVVLLLWRLYFVFVAREAARQPAPPVMRADPAAMAPAGPSLQPLPAQDLARFRAEEELALGTYGWVDKEKGIVRIPIERAMRLLAERGLPAPAATPPSAAAPPAGDRGRE